MLHDPPIQIPTLALCPKGLSIFSPAKNGTLYVGVTSDLLRRMEEHCQGPASSFVRRYDVTRLVYFEEYPLYADAIRRETCLKRWKRAWKLALIEKHNPDWNDLLDGWNR